MVKCPYCGGSGVEGIDRCYPPNDIICGLCNGNKEVTKNRADMFEFICNLMYPNTSLVKYSCSLSALQYLDHLIWCKENNK